MVKILVTPHSLNTKAEIALEQLLSCTSSKLVCIISNVDDDSIIEVNEEVFKVIHINRESLSELLDMDLQSLPNLAIVFLPANDEFSIASITADYKQDILITIGSPIKFAGSKTIILNNSYVINSGMASRVKCDIEVYSTSDTGYYSVGESGYHTSVSRDVAFATDILAGLLRGAIARAILHE